MERSTAAVLAATTSTGAATAAGGWTLLTGSATSWPALFAVVLGSAALLGEGAMRLPRIRRIERFELAVYLQHGLAHGSAVAGLWALTARTDRPATWILAAVIVGAALCTAWIRYGPYEYARETLAVFGAAVAVTAIGAGAYLLTDSSDIAAAVVLSALLLLGTLPVRSIPGVPLPLEVAWLGPAVAVAVSVPVARPLADQVATHPLEFAAIVGVGAIVAGAQCAVQFAVVRMLQPTVPFVLAVEREAAAAQESAARRKSPGRRWDTDHYELLDPTLEESVRHIRRYGSTRQMHAIETALERLRRFGDDTYLHEVLWQHERPVDRLSSIRRPLSRWTGRLLAGTATVEVVSTARAEGVVVDRIWPRLELVLPPSVRSRHAWSERAVALSRVVVASATAASITLVAASLYLYAVAPLVIGAIALLTGRGLVADTYRRRALAIGVFRMHLIRTLGLPEPATHDELVAMGGVLDGTVASYPMAPSAEAARETRAGAAISADVAADLSSAVVTEVRAELRTLERRQEALLGDLATSVTGAPAVDRIASKLVETTIRALGDRLDTAVTTLRSQTEETITRAVAAVLAGPPLIEFSGYFAVELDGARAGVHRGSDGVIHAAPGMSIGLAVTVLADPAARNVAPDRRATGEHDFVALETVSVDGVETRAFVQFDVLLDSATLTPIPRRQTLRLPRAKGERSGSIELELPDSAGVHEAWLQLYQEGRLIQAVVLAVDTRVTDRAQRGER